MGCAATRAYGQHGNAACWPARQRMVERAAGCKRVRAMLNGAGVLLLRRTCRTMGLKCPMQSTTSRAVRVEGAAEPSARRDRAAPSGCTVMPWEGAWQRVGTATSGVVECGVVECGAARAHGICVDLPALMSAMRRCEGGVGVAGQRSRLPTPLTAHPRLAASLQCDSSSPHAMRVHTAARTPPPCRPAGLLLSAKVTACTHYRPLPHVPTFQGRALQHHAPSCLQLPPHQLHEPAPSVATVLYISS